MYSSTSLIDDVVCVTGVDAARDSSCPRICPQAGGGDPVCGSDDVIYRNLCELKKKSCGKGNIMSTLNPFGVQKTQNTLQFQNIKNIYNNNFCIKEKPIVLSTLENSQRFNISMHINILKVLLFTEQNIHLFKNNNTNYIMWNLRKEYNLKQVLHRYSSLYK